MIKAIIFDFDGLILDTETPWFIAYRDVYRTYGLEMPLEVWVKCIGTSYEVFDPHLYMQERSQQTIDRSEVDRLAKTRFQEFMSTQSIRPGVLDYVQKAKQLGLKIGLASSSTRDWVESYLAEHQLLAFFESVNTSDDVTRVKPDPELYLKALANLGVQGAEAIAFEDSENGAKAAKAAGLHCVAVPNEVTDLLAFEMVDLRIPSMTAMKLEDVIQQIVDNQATI